MHWLTKWADHEEGVKQKMLGAHENDSSQTISSFYRPHKGSTCNTEWKETQEHMDWEREADLQGQVSGKGSNSFFLGRPLKKYNRVILYYQLSW